MQQNSFAGPAQCIMIGTMSVQTQSSSFSVKLFFRAFLPSATSLVTCVFLAIISIGLHAVLILINGQARLGIVNSQYLDSYNTTFIDPVLRFMNNPNVNSWLGIVLWGAFGWILYTCIAVVADAVHEWRLARSQVRIVGGAIVRSPMQKPLLARLAWRFVVAMALAFFTVAVVPLIQYALRNDYYMVTSVDTMSGLPYFVRSVGVLILVFHGYLVLLRLYLQRTRVFGEIVG